MGDSTRRNYPMEICVFLAQFKTSQDFLNIFCLKSVFSYMTPTEMSVLFKDNATYLQHPVTGCTHKEIHYLNKIHLHQFPFLKTVGLRFCFHYE